MQRDRLSAAITRNLHEIGLARHERNAIAGMSAAETGHTWDFFRLAEIALFNDMIAHAMKVLDRNPQSATFWYVFRCLESKLLPFLATASITLDQIGHLADRLKCIRDETHFHIDRDAVRDPSTVWNKVRIPANEFARVTDTVWDILLHAHRLHFGADFESPAYDGSDITPILIAARDEGLLLGHRRR